MYRKIEKEMEKAFLGPNDELQQLELEFSPEW